MNETGRPATRARRYKPPLITLMLAFVLVIANGAVALVVLGQQRDANVRVQRSLQAMLVLKEVEDYAEGGGKDQRLYRLSGDPQRLAAYLNNERKLPDELARLRALVRDDPAQLQRLSVLVTLIDQDRAALAASMASIEPPIASGVVPDTLAAGVDRTNNIVSAINDMLQGEARQLDSHLAKIQAQTVVTAVTVILGTIGGAALIVAIFLLIRRELRRTQLLAAEQSSALRDSEQRFRRIFEQSPLGIVLVEPADQSIVQANPTFCRMVGYESEAIVGNAIADLLHMDDRFLLTDVIMRSTDPDHEGVELRLVTRFGIVAWARLHFTRLSSSDHRPGLLLGLAEDITREKRVEAELRQAQKMEAVGQLTGGIAHDFNNLLGVIIGNVEFLIDTVQGNQEQTDLAKEILNSALSGADLTRRLLAFARRQTLQPRVIDLNAYLPNHIAILRRFLGQTIQVVTHLAHDLWPTRADPSQVGDALLNLAINARDAMPHGGHILIETENAHLEADQDDVEVTVGDYVVLSMNDSGTGMAPEVLERAMEPFFSTKGPGSGSGLGLSMIFGFAKQSGGHLKIESQLGQGTTVRLYLPRSQSVEVDAAEHSVDAPMPTGSETVLLVDDNVEMRALARQHLLSLGYQVSEAGNGPAALAILRRGESFDLLFTDIVMPGGMTGYQLAMVARQLQPELRVLFTTGYAGAGSRAGAADPRAGLMLRKPYRKQALAAKVRAALEA